METTPLRFRPWRESDAPMLFKYAFASEVECSFVNFDIETECSKFMVRNEKKLHVKI